MTSATVLLHLALSLLMAVQQPNVPESLRLQAISVANIAIEAALKEQAGMAVPVMVAKPIVVPEISTSASCEVSWDVISDAIVDGATHGVSSEFIIKAERCDQTLSLDVYQAEGDIWSQDVPVNKDYTSIRMSPGHIIEDGYWKPVFVFAGEKKVLNIKIND